VRPNIETGGYTKRREQGVTEKKERVLGSKAEKPLVQIPPEIRKKKHLIMEERED